jgi:hypothetical protein
MPAFGEAGIWPAVSGAAIGVIATLLVVWARSRSHSQPGGTEDLRCEPGQTLGSVLGGGLVKLFRISEEISLGTDPASTTVTLVCSQNHAIPADPIQELWSEEAIIVKIPAEGPCQNHDSDAWSYRFEVKPPGKPLLRTGPVYIIGQGRGGYPGFADVPAAPFRRHEGASDRGKGRIVLPDQTPAIR